MNRSLKHTLLALMFAITPIGVLAEEYEMGEPVTIQIEMIVTNIIDTPDVYCTEPNAPPVCLVVVEEDEKNPRISTGEVVSP